MAWLRNTATNIPFALVNRTTGQALTGAAVTVRRCLDGGSQQTAEGIITEKGNGQYNFAATTNDMGASVVGFLITADNAIPLNVTLSTETVASGSSQQVTGVYSYLTGTSPTLAQQLLSVQLAILAIESGAQAVSVQGRTITNADLRTLYDREERLHNSVARGRSGTRRVVEF